ncbi:MAG: hypothetical protein OEX08_00605 [Candidatus Nomurabacteria bacterium]|nr:hypothetical protein [Candidatus Nomurabacteria bacterium]
MAIIIPELLTDFTPDKEAKNRLIEWKKILQQICKEYGWALRVHAVLKEEGDYTVNESDDDEKNSFFVVDWDFGVLNPSCYEIITPGVLFLSADMARHVFGDLNGNHQEYVDFYKEDSPAVSAPGIKISDDHEMTWNEALEFLIAQGKWLQSLVPELPEEKV